MADNRADVAVQVDEMADHFDFGSNSSKDVEFQFEKTGQDLETYIEDIADTVRIGLDQSIAILTPWFFNNMPRMYYQTTPRAEKVRHLSAVITGHVFETKQTVELWDHDRTKVTYIGPGSDRQILLAMSQKITPFHIKMGSLYFSRDKLLFLSTFLCKDYVPIDEQNRHVVNKITEAKKLLLTEMPNAEIEIDHYLSHLDHDFVVYATPSRLQITFRMLRHMLVHEGAHTFIEPFENSASGRLTLGLKGVETGEVLEHIFLLMNSHGFDIVRFFTVNFSEGYREPITVMHFILKHQTANKISIEHISVIKMVKALRTLGWTDSDDYNEFMKKPFDLSINAVNLLRSMASWVHILLGKENIYYYSEYKIYNTFVNNAEITNDLVELFRLKFNPLDPDARKNAGYAKAKAKLRTKIEDLIDKVERHIYDEAIKFVESTLKTNYFLPTKTGMAFRLSPDILDARHYPQKPFGIFFIIGRNYRFFQVRWKDVARGGLRIVMPRNQTDYGYAISGLFDEVYGLSHAQQLKNKDIPEGGSKAVMVLREGAYKNRAVRSGINALLDLLVSEDETHEQKSSTQVSYYHDEEIIYLGPDENMTNDLIEWVPKHAARRGYRYAEAFISSKPGAGINHKEYGVTSEGLHVFVDHTLRFLDITPTKEKFTVKITGGPDGDVAGNELNILYREYGENARIVAVADGGGAAHDPEGLDWTELHRLIEKGYSIVKFSEEKLSKSNKAFVIHADTSENIRIRNELHAVTYADIFIPAGGRPYTVSAKNYKKFFDETGVPSCRAIIEGANIFFTDEARVLLQERGILMIKDSSANKTGVICSSFEIIASLMLSEQEFNEIKDEYVQQVIEILREKAGKEAKLLFTEYLNRRRNMTLVNLSTEISREINQVTDILLERFLEKKEEILSDLMFKNLVLKHCPVVLQEKYKDRILSQLPEAHQIAILAAFIASHIVYSEGLGWLDSISEGRRYKAAMAYMRNDLLAEQLIDQVSKSGMDNTKSIVEILRRSAAKDLTMMNLDVESENINENKQPVEKVAQDTQT
ncbi:MAG: NAD-glutamate dehydrogenase domain-containing protein [Oligoflexales bacterium]